ncbi:glycerophosphoryl diester phosphodiesterase [Strigomonas culicis]|nr:glycerophosphoryl diester phosphodiesterase [Strigomonas culicis]|eukprot:EPY33900.1 glycerophosphoryl diester phosphodiesterase [Strigomonas culicis]
MLELDVHQSKDGKIVVCHDSLLDRVCGPGTGDISNLTVGPDPDATLPQVLREIPIEFASEKTHTFKADASIPVNSETRICLLTEVFDRFKGVPLHVDIKEEGYAFVKQVFDLLEDYGREEITFIGSSHWGNKKHINRYFSLCSKEKRLRYRVFGGTSDYCRTHLLYRMGLLPFVKLDYDVFSIPVHVGAMRKDCEKEYGNFLTRILTPWVTSPTLWKYLQTREIAVLGWVFNEEEDLKRVLQFPLNGLITDDPILLYNLVLKDHNSLVTL